MQPLATGRGFVGSPLPRAFLSVYINMDRIQFKVIMDPVGKGRPRFSMINKRPIAYTPEKTRQAEKTLKIHAMKSMIGEKPFNQHIALRVDIVAAFSIPTSYSKMRKANCLDGLERPTKKPDGDNIIKLVCDSMNGIVYEDDKQITETSCSKIYSENGQGYLLITVEAL